MMGRTSAGHRPRGTDMLLAAGLLAWMVSGCGAPRETGPHDDHAGGEEGSGHGEAAERGPLGGRLFKGGDVQLELRIEEAGIPPEFRAHLYDARGKPIVPVEGSLIVVLDRFAGRRDSLGFRAMGDYFQSVRAVEEPHSFKAAVTLQRRGQRHVWSYDQEEGRVTLSEEALRSSGIETGTAGSHRIEVRVQAPGEVKLNSERVIQVRPRFPGVVQRLAKSQGDAVRAGQLLAVIHSNESLTDYEITSPLSGTVVARDVVEGQSVDHESVLYTVADLSSVWVDLALFPQIASQVRRGQSVRVKSEAGDAQEVEGTISYVGPLLEQDTRVSYGRVVLANAGNRWQPGLFVTASVIVDRATVVVAVPEDAIVRTSRGPAVFRAEGSTFELQPVTPGRSDGVWTEIVDGLEPGARIVIRSAFLLKAELGKSEATHDH